MSVIEYIGARYVPVLATPIEWDSTIAYEALTIVTYQGNSYTSRQAVPVGTAITNENYWALTGNYDAQIEQYRQEVRNYDARITNNAAAISAETAARIQADNDINATVGGFDNRITANANAIGAETTAREQADITLGNAIGDEEAARILADNTLQGAIDNRYTKAESDERYQMKQGAGGDDVLVCIGDSILAGWSEENPNSIPAWDKYLADALGYAADHRFSQGLGGSGFASGTTFAQMVPALASAVSAGGFEASDVRLVVVAGGVNDRRNNVGSSAFQTGVKELINAVGSTFPNATLHIFPALIGNRGLSTDLIAQERDAARALLTISSAYAKRVVLHEGVWSWNYENDGGVSYDGIHLLESGEKVAGASMAQEINGGSAYIEVGWFPVYDINGGLATSGTRRGSTVNFNISTNISSAANNIALGVARKYGRINGSFSVSNETETGTRIFFYNTALGGFTSFNVLANAGCYGNVCYHIEDDFS